MYWDAGEVDSTNLGKCRTGRRLRGWELRDWSLSLPFVGDGEEILEWKVEAGQQIGAISLGLVND
jgi:hypothetical protein